MLGVLGFPYFRAGGGLQGGGADHGLVSIIGLSLFICLEREEKQSGAQRALAIVLILMSVTGLETWLFFLFGRVDRLVDAARAPVLESNVPLNRKNPNARFYIATLGAIALAALITDGSPWRTSPARACIIPSGTSRSLSMPLSER